MKNNPLYIIIFSDKTNFVGGNNYFKSKWLEIPFSKKIEKILYRLPGGDYLYLAGYDKYFHMIEATQDWMKVGENKVKKINNKPRIEYAYIMGKKDNKIVRYKITLFNKENEKIGDITKRIFDINNPEVKGLNPKNWR